MPRHLAGTGPERGIRAMTTPRRHARGEHFVRPGVPPAVAEARVQLPALPVEATPTDGEVPRAPTVGPSRRASDHPPREPANPNAGKP
jgi:hypothetical protein